MMELIREEGDNLVDTLADTLAEMQTDLDEIKQRLNKIEGLVEKKPQSPYPLNQGYADCGCTPFEICLKHQLH